MMLSGITREETWFLVVGHAFHDQRRPSIASNSTKSILGWSDFKCGSSGFFKVISWNVMF
jgi:hypothetical protein